MNKPFLLRVVAVVFTMLLVAAGCTTSPDTDTTTTVSENAEPSTMQNDMADKPMADKMSVLDRVKERGTLKCGVSGSAAAFSVTNPEGGYTGFDVDYCRVVAAAILGDSTAVEFKSLTAAERFISLKAGDVDLLMRNTTWTLTRDSDGMDFGPTTYYDGQQVMAKTASGFTPESDVIDLEGATVCTNAGTTTEKNIEDALVAAGISDAVTVKTFESLDQVMLDFKAGGCDAVTTDGSGLVGHKANEGINEEWVIFPAKALSKEPLGPVYGQNDSKFADVVNWAVYATFLADEKGINQANVDEMATSPLDAEMGRLLGHDDEEDTQSKLGLERDAFYNVISQVGNYDDIFNRNLVPVGLSREGTPNAGWQDGGLIYAPPAR